MDIESSEHEARLMRRIRFAWRSTLIAVALLWLLATAFPPARPPPASPPAPAAFPGPPGCVKSLTTNELHGRTVLYRQDGRPLFRQVTPPREVTYSGESPTRR